MKRLVAALLLIASPAFAGEMTLPIVGGIDGDTIRTYLPLPCPLCRASVRIIGIDTPEKGYRAKCEKEHQLALEATEFTAKLVGRASHMKVSRFKWDKYGGRIDAQVEINGVDLGTELILGGFAVPYTGEGPKKDWCK